MTWIHALTALLVLVPAPDSLLRSDALRADVAVLRTALTGLHPGLYRYNTPRQVDSIFASVNAQFARDRTATDAYLVLSEAMSALKCGHTFLNPVNQSRAVAEAVFRNTPRVPFYFRWIDSAMVVTRDASSPARFPVGTRIDAINGVPASAILRTLVPYSRTDGNNAAKRVANLDLLPAERWQAFDVFYPLLFAASDTAWTFRAQLPGAAKPVVSSARPSNATQRMALYDSLKKASADTAPPWTLGYARDGSAILRMPTWVTYNETWDWKGFVDRAFDTLIARRVPALIVDLRGNEGGTSVGDAILARLVARDTVLEQFQRYTRYRSLPDTSIRRYLDTWDRSFDDWKEQARPAADRSGFFRLVREFDTSSTGVVGTVIGAKAPRYGGKVVVLVGAENSSATFEFAQSARLLGVAKLVGQPTGGNQRGINGGAFYFLRLPNSRIEVDLPLIGYFPSGARPDGGIQPDVHVRERWADVAAGRDATMEAALRLVKTK